jgi:RNase adaptor protein for sRNA GlmZ degradation
VANWTNWTTVQFVVQFVVHSASLHYTYKNTHRIHPPQLLNPEGTLYQSLTLEKETTQNLQALAYA